MITIVNDIPSDVMLESYNNKIQRVLKYGNRDSLSWRILSGDAGLTDVIFTLPGGATKTVNINRMSLPLTLKPDYKQLVVINKTEFSNSPNIAAAQNAIIEASNISKLDFETIYSPEFAMSVLLWVSKGVYVPPRDMILTSEGTAPLTEGGTPVPVTRLTIKTNSLAYVGSILLTVVDTNTTQPPQQIKEYNLSEMTNCGVPGRWEVKGVTVSDWFSEQDNVDSIARNVLFEIGTINEFDPIYNMTTNTKDYDYSEEGKLKYVLTPSAENVTTRLIGKLDLVITSIAQPTVNVININQIDLNNTTRFVSGIRKAEISADVSDQDIIDQIKVALDGGTKNDIYREDNGELPAVNINQYVDVTIADGVVNIKPKAEFEYTRIIGLTRVYITRVPTKVTKYTVDTLFGKKGNAFNYDISPSLTVEEASHNLVLEILKPIALSTNYNVSEKHLNVTISDMVVTIKTADDASALVDCDITVTLNRLTPKAAILDLSTLGNYGSMNIPEPDKSAEGYSFRALIESILLDASIAAGSEEIIDLDSMDIRLVDTWNNGYILVDKPRIDSQLIGMFSVYYTDIRPGVLNTNLSTLSNIDRPGMMMIPKSKEPTSYPTAELVNYILSQSTIGTYDPIKAEVRGTYTNQLMTIEPQEQIQPDTTIGVLKAIFVTYGVDGNWIPKLNLSDVTNGDTNGEWTIDLPSAITEDNYTFVVDAMKKTLAKQYKVSTDGLIGNYQNGVLTLTTDPTKLVDADGTLTIIENIVDPGNVPSNAFSFTSVTGDVDDFYLEMTLNTFRPSSDWQFWMNGDLVADSSGLVFAKDVVVNVSSNYVTITLPKVLFTSKTTSFALSGTLNDVTLSTQTNGEYDRQTTIDSFSTTAKSQSIKLACLIAVPNQLPANVTSMNEMFYNAARFNYDISGWDVSHVTDMNAAFSGAKKFNQDLSGWDVSNVTIMNSMFSSAYAFNQNISTWDVSNVLDMTYMFYYAEAFNQDLSGWNVTKITREPYNFCNLNTYTEPKPIWNEPVVGGIGGIPGRE